MAKGHCKCKAAECEECPEWIFTFADLVMLMMGFFVILWVTKPAGTPAAAATGKEQAAEEKWLDTVANIRAAFGHMPDPESKDPVDLRAMTKKLEMLEPPNKGKGKGGETTEPKQGAEGTDPLVMNVRPGQHVTLGGRLTFAPGDAAIAPATQGVLEEVVKAVRGYRNIFLVKGHASLDDFGDGATPQQRMNVSLQRAQACADYLVAHGVAPDTIRVQGCSTFEPVLQRTYTADAQAANRRVEVEATNQLVGDRQDLTTSTAAPLSAPQHPSSDVERRN